MSVTDKHVRELERHILAALEATPMIERGPDHWEKVRDLEANLARPEKPAKILTRIPQDMHTLLTQEAADQGVSVNQYVVAVLAGALRYKVER